jgi:hypothetical protein
LPVSAIANKSKGSSKKPATTPAAIAKEKSEEELRQQMRDELKSLNTTVSIIPGGCTSLLQPCDLTANHILKALIKEYEEDHIDNNFDQWKSGKYNVSERRILMTKWVGRAWEELHIHYKDAIVKTFRQTAIALPPDGSCDKEIKIRGLDDLEIGDYSREQEAQDKEVEGKWDSILLYILLTNQETDTLSPPPGAPSLPPLPFNLRSSRITYYTTEEVANGYLEADTDIEDGDDVATDTEDDADHLVDSDNEDEFDPDLDGDDIYGDETMSD